MVDEIQTVEIASEHEKVETPKSEVVTRSDLKEKGWSATEIDSAEKRGMVAKSEENKQGKNTESEKKLEILNPSEKIAEPEKKLDTSLPDFTFKTPEQEKVFLDAFGAGTPQRAMYFRMKNERLARQRAESERDKVVLELQLERDKALHLENKPQVETDANGNVIDPEDKPLTMKQLKIMQKAEMDSLNKQKSELDERSFRVSEAMKIQEEYAKSTIHDFEETVKLATDLVQNIDQVQEKWKRDKVVKLLKDLQLTAATADKYGVDDYTASMIAYEMGQLHPNYGKPKPAADTNGTDPKGHGNLTPEQMKRLEENTQRRTSSASLPGSSGRRVISIDDVTIKDVLKMSPEERFKFKKDHPEKMRKLLRG